MMKMGMDERVGNDKMKRGLLCWFGDRQKQNSEHTLACVLINVM